MRSSDYIGKSERIRTREINVTDKISSISSEISSLEATRISIESEIVVLQSQLYVEKTYYDSKGNVQTRIEVNHDVSARISHLSSRAIALSNEITNLKSQRHILIAELAEINIEKGIAIKEIQQVADKKISNYSKAANMTADYASVVTDLQSRYKHNLNDLSVAASMLGASIRSVSGTFNAGPRGSGLSGRSRNINTARVGGIGRLGNENKKTSQNIAASSSDLKKFIPTNSPKVSTNVNFAAKSVNSELKKSKPVPIVKPLKNNTVKSETKSTAVPQPRLNLIRKEPVRQETATNQKQNLSANKVKQEASREYKETETFTIKFAPDYIDGNKYHFIKKIANGKGSLERLPKNYKGTQKPDKFKFDADRRILFIIEDKNYQIEKNRNYNNLIANIAKQAINRIKNCIDVDVPAELMENKEASHIDKLVLTFSVDVKGHYFHDDGTEVSIDEYNTFESRVKKLIIKNLGNPEVFKNVKLRIAILFDEFPNKPLDVSNYTDSTLFGD